MWPNVMGGMYLRMRIVCGRTYTIPCVSSPSRHTRHIPDARNTSGRAARLPLFHSLGRLRAVHEGTSMMNSC